MKRLALLGLALALLTPAAFSQPVTTNDPDEDIFDRFLSDPRDGDGVSQTPVMDMEADSNGRLLIAYGVVDAVESSARVEIVVRLKNMNWVKLGTMSIDPPGGYGNGTIVKAVSVAVVNKVGGVDDNNFGFVTAVFEQNGTDWITYHSGPIKTAWKSLKPNELVITGVAKKAVTDPTFLNPSIAVLPVGPSDFSKYIVAIACAMPGPAATDSSIKLIWMDFFSPNYFGPELYTVAGPGSTLMTGKYGRPSLTVDPVNAYWGVAFDNLTEPRVHVVAGKPGDQPNNMAKVFQTGSTDHHPAIRSFKGDISLVTLGAKGDGNYWVMKGYYGVLHTANTFTSIGDLDDNCRTPADIDMKNNDVYVAASCYDDAARKYRITTIEFKRTVGFFQYARLEDSPSFSSRQPRMAVAPPGAGITYYAVGFANDRLFPIPGGVSGASSVMIDP